jgi:hypothetical protein
MNSTKEFLQGTAFNLHVALLLAMASSHVSEVSANAENKLRILRELISPHNPLLVT